MNTLKEVCPSSMHRPCTRRVRAAGQGRFIDGRCTRICYKTRLAGLAILGLFALGMPPNAFAQEAPPSITVPYARVKPGLTAHASDPAWAQSALIDRMPPPSNGLPATPSPLEPPPRTTIRLLWDESFLYVRFLCEDREQYVAREGRDAKLYEGDVVEVFLDPTGTARDYFELQVSPRNDLFDVRFKVDVEAKSEPNGVLTWDILSKHHRRDIAWNYQKVVSAVRSLTPDKFWIVDIAIPASDLGLEKGFSPMELRANFLRYDWQLLDGKRYLVPQNWSPVVFGRPHVSPQAMGFLHLEKP